MVRKTDAIKQHFADVLFDHLPLGIALFDARDLRLLIANSLYLKSLDIYLDPRWRNGKIIGHPLTAWLPNAESAEVIALFRSVAETGTLYREDDSAFPFPMYGMTYWNWTLDPVCDTSGHTIQLLLTLTDTTAEVLARQQSEQAQESLAWTSRSLEAERQKLEVHARLRTILDKLPEGILLVEASDGFISYANAAAAHILGVPIMGLVGVPFNSHSKDYSPIYIAGRPIPPWNFAVVRALSGETVKGQETMVTKSDGSKVVTLSSSAPLRNEDGIKTGAVIVFQDITKQKTIEEQKNEFISIAGHELRTPTTAIVGFAEILQMKMTLENSSDPIAQRAIAHIVEQGEQLTRLIEEMLDVTRIETAQLPLHLGQYNLVDTLIHVIESQSITTKKHDIRLTVQGLETPDILMGNFDENRMIQVVNNLISNAIKYSPAGCEIEVGLRYTPQQPGEALIWVKDQGIGIPAGELPYIFERFRRVSSLDHSISGLGLGLYLVKELVTRHAGRVWVESTEGSGSTFYIRLPLNRNRQTS